MPKHEISRIEKRYSINRDTMHKNEISRTKNREDRVNVKAINPDER